jgi:hypothetical protein
MKKNVSKSTAKPLLSAATSKRSQKRPRTLTREQKQARKHNAMLDQLFQFAMPDGRIADRVPYGELRGALSVLVTPDPVLPDGTPARGATAAQRKAALERYRHVARECGFTPLMLPRGERLL